VLDGDQVRAPRFGHGGETLHGSLAQDVLHLDGLSGAKKGAVEDGVAHDRPPIILVGKLKPPGSIPWFQLEWTKAMSSWSGP